MMQRLRERRPLILGTIGTLILVMLWEAASHYSWINPFFISRPSLISEAFLRQLNSGQLAVDFWVSFQEFLIAISASFIVGVGLGLLMGAYRSLEGLFDPYVWFLYSAPLIAFYPLFIMWLGLGSKTVVAIAFLLAFIPILTNTVLGVKLADPLLIKAARSFGASQREIFLKIALPASVPVIVAGLRLGIGRALIGVVIGEFFGANAGLGYRLNFYGARLKVTDFFVPILVIAVMGVLFTQIIRLAENRMLFWKGD